jgi:hypothetical protein
MRNNLALLISLVFLTACGGGSAGGSSGSTGSTIPSGSVSGITFDGLILGGTVSVYDFTSGTKGAQLGQATTDGTSGLYSLSLQVESRPVLLEITGGYYIEEAGPGSTQVALSSKQKLTALANYTTGATLNISVTTLTHLAAGLAAFEISKGTAVSTAINDANNRASSLVGVNILTTTPKEITDVTNASATLTPELRYGFLAGAISMWTYNNAPSASVAHLSPFTSIDFAQLLYQDISADGLLDGFAFDSTGAKAQLSFGTTPLGPDVYRMGLGVSLVQMAGDPNNKTGLTGSKVLSFAQSYIASSDGIFNGVAPTAFAATTTAITSPTTNAWARKTISVIPTASSPFGLNTVELIVDGVSVATSANAAPASFSLNTTAYADGAHTLTVRSTDRGGFVATSTVQSNIDNTPPTSNGNYYYFNGCSGLCRNNNGNASDNYSGVVSATILANGQTSAVGVGGSWSLVTDAGPSSPHNVVWPTVRIMDAAGNCSDYFYNQTTTGAFTLIALGTC